KTCADRRVLHGTLNRVLPVTHTNHHSRFQLTLLAQKSPSISGGSRWGTGSGYVSENHAQFVNNALLSAVFAAIPPCPPWRRRKIPENTLHLS
ncbi:MAG: hypothetical protein ACK4Y5_10295, partial [Acetobacteraceae bacterium]